MEKFAIHWSVNSAATKYLAKSTSLPRAIVRIGFTSEVSRLVEVEETNGLEDCRMREKERKRRNETIVVLAERQERAVNWNEPV